MTTQITNIAHLLDLTDYAAINAEQMPEGITVHLNGDVIARVGDRATTARAMDWRLVLGRIDVQPIFEWRAITAH